MNMIPMLAAATGEGMIRLMLYVLVIMACLAIVWWLGKLLLTTLEASAKVLQIWTVLFYIIGALALINFLLSLIGHPIIPFN